MARARGEGWKARVKAWLEQSPDLETARDGLYGLLDGSGPFEEEVIAAHLAAELGGRYSVREEEAAQLAGEDPFDLPPAEAIDYFLRKQVVSRVAFQAADAEMRHRQFVVSAVSDRYVLDHLHAALADAVAEGGTLQEFIAGTDALFDKRGLTRNADWYWETVFRNNIQSAYSAGRYAQQEEAFGSRPYLEYVAVMDDAIRPEHESWHGTIRRHDDPWWSTHYPPCGHRCRCHARASSGQELERTGRKVTSDESLPLDKPEGGFGTPPGRRREGERAVAEMLAGLDRKDTLGPGGADLSRAADAGRVATVDRWMGVDRKRQAALVREVGAYRVVKKEPAKLAAGERRLEVAMPSASEPRFEQQLGRLMSDGRLGGLRAGAVTSEAAVQPWREGWDNPDWPIDRELLPAAVVGKTTRVRFESGVTGPELADLFHYWGETGVATPGGIRQPNPLRDAFDAMEVVVRGEGEGAPLEGMVRAVRNVRQEGPKQWVVALTREAREGWQHEDVLVNRALWETLE